MQIWEYSQINCDIIHIYKYQDKYIFCIYLYASIRTS